MRPTDKARALLKLGDLRAALQVLREGLDEVREKINEIPEDEPLRPSDLLWMVNSDLEGLDPDNFIGDRIEWQRLLCRDVEIAGDTARIYLVGLAPDCQKLPRFIAGVAAELTGLECFVSCEW